MRSEALQGDGGGAPDSKRPHVSTPVVVVLDANRLSESGRMSSSGNEELW
jgi:hypothetical protein